MADLLRSAFGTGPNRCLISTNFWGGAQYAVNMSLIDRPEARRNYALAAIGSSGQAALGQYFTHYQVALDGDKFLGTCTVDPS
jgi:hypothetical protein